MSAAGVLSALAVGVITLIVLGVVAYYTRGEVRQVQKQTRQEQLFEWLLDNIDKARDLGVAEVGKVDEAGGSVLGVRFDDDEYVFVSVEQG